MTKPVELYACLYVKEFPAQALLRLQPELHGKPCVVLEGEAPLQAVCSLNTKARLLQSDGEYLRASHTGAAFSAQDYLVRVAEGAEEKVPKHEKAAAH